MTEKDAINRFKTLQITGPTDAVVAGAVATDAGLRWGLSARASRELGIVAAELASNLHKHGGGGVLVLQDSPHAVVIVASDQGTGISDSEAALLDHNSRGQRVPLDGAPLTSLGCGLGAVSRLTDELEFVTPPDGGFEVRATKWKDARGHARG